MMTSGFQRETPSPPWRDRITVRRLYVIPGNFEKDYVVEIRPQDLRGLWRLGTRYRNTFMGMACRLRTIHISGRYWRDYVSAFVELPPAADGRRLASRCCASARVATVCC